jgi:glycosyltransferase involved in cell wall biosynthesis
MSVFNGQAFLKEAIESILGQTFRDFEFLVIDDGSTDSTAEILSNYASHDGRMRVLRHENKGRAASLNDGIKFSNGKYVARMDADDIALPHRLLDQIDFMERHPKVGLLGGAVERINTVGQPIDILRPPLEDLEIKSVMLHYNPMCHPALVMRREVVLGSGGYRQALLDADDYDLWLRIGERSKLANLDKVILQYRIHANQVSVRGMRHQVLCFLAARAAASLRRSGSPDPLSNIEEVNTALLHQLGVSTDEIQELLVGGYTYWMNALERSDPEAALRATEELLKLSASGYVERSLLANVLLMAAGIHYSQGRPLQALFSTVRAVVVRPIVAGRPVRRAFSHFATALKSWLGSTRQ